MKESARGTAMPETAIALAVVLLVIFGITQLSLLGFYAATTEGAAFVGAHALSLNSTGSNSADTTYAATILPTPFPIVKPGELLVTYPSSSMLQLMVTKTAPGLIMVPGAPSSVSVQGADQEPILGSATLNLPPPFSIADQAPLKNYCSLNTKIGCDASYAMYIGQCYEGGDVGSCGYPNSGNGVNGPFSEWQCRQSLFVQMASVIESNAVWPSGTVAPGTAGGRWDPDPKNKNFDSAEAAVYNYDSQSSKWGSTPSC